MGTQFKPAIKTGLLTASLVLFSGCANQMYVPIFEAGEDPELRRPVERPSSSSSASKTAGQSSSSTPKGLGDSKASDPTVPTSTVPKGLGDKPPEPVRQIVEPETVEQASRGKPRSKAVDKLLAQSQSYLDQSNYQQSIQSAERALRIQPGLIDAYYLLASNKMRQGQWRSALQFANKGLQQRGRNSNFVEKLTEIARQARAMMD